MGHLRSIKRSLDRARGGIESVRRRGRNRKGKHADVGEIDPKMSEILLAYAAEFLDLSESLEMDHDVLQIAAFCWNLSYMPDAEATAFLEKELLSKLGSGRRAQQYREFINAMVVRRCKMYPHVWRIIVDWELTDEGGGQARLLVSSMPIEGEVVSFQEPKHSQRGDG
ncbi:MAG TPA: hypothetical protein ENN87_00375 [Phycisphaerales bacterium]|nr:hypothetical protein [Phycisphaerales bacterium]